MSEVTRNEWEESGNPIMYTQWNSEFAQANRNRIREKYLKIIGQTTIDEVDIERARFTGLLNEIAEDPTVVIDVVDGEEIVLRPTEEAIL